MYSAFLCIAHFPLQELQLFTRGFWKTMVHFHWNYLGGKKTFSPNCPWKMEPLGPGLIGGHTCRLYFISTSFPLFVFWSIENGAKEENLVEVVRWQSPGFFLEIAVGKEAWFSRRGVQQHVNLFNWVCAQLYNCAKCHLYAPLCNIVGFIQSGSTSKSHTLNP